MSWLYLPAQVVDCSEAGCLDGERSATSKKINTASKSSRRGSKMATSTTRRSGTTSRRSTGVHGLDVWMSSLLDSLASHSVEPARNLGIPTSEIYGRIPLASLEKSLQRGFYWKMSQGCFRSIISDKFSETWPRAGTMLNGTVYQRAPSAPITREIGCGLWPCPTVGDSKGARNSTANRRSIPPTGVHAGDTLVDAVTKFPTPRSIDARGIYTSQNSIDKYAAGMTLTQAVRRLPTPTVNDSKNNGGPSQQRRAEHGFSSTLNQEIGGRLNPDWVEWLMGWPIGWTALEPLEMDRFQQWLRQHGYCCLE